MGNIEHVYKDFLYAYLTGKASDVEGYIDEKTLLMDFLSCRKGKQIITTLPFLKESFNIFHVASAEPIRRKQGNEIHLYATVSFLTGIEEGNEIGILIDHARTMPIGTEIKENHEIYWLAFGGKVEFVFDSCKEKIVSFSYDQEFIGGNTYLMKGYWSPYSEHPEWIAEDLLREGNGNEKDTILRFFWGLDRMDERMMASCLNEDSRLQIARPLGGKLTASSLASFIQEAKKLYDMNYHLLMIKGTGPGTYSLFRLRQDRLGNKFRGYKDLYTLYFNEIFSIKMQDGKIQDIDSRRVEIPLTAGYQVKVL